jgi:hypothetical protein
MPFTVCASTGVLASIHRLARAELTSNNSMRTTFEFVIVVNNKEVSLSTIDEKKMRRSLLETNTFPFARATVGTVRRVVFL